VVSVRKCALFLAVVAMLAVSGSAAAMHTTAPRSDMTLGITVRFPKPIIAGKPVTVWFVVYNYGTRKSADYSFAVAGGTGRYAWKYRFESGLMINKIGSVVKAGSGDWLPGLDPRRGRTFKATILKGYNGGLHTTLFMDGSKVMADADVTPAPGHTLNSGLVLISNKVSRQKLPLQMVARNFGSEDLSYNVHFNPNLKFWDYQSAHGLQFREGIFVPTTVDYNLPRRGMDIHSFAVSFTDSHTVSAFYRQSDGAQVAYSWFVDR
jgi:hypothetical protein